MDTIRRLQELSMRIDHLENAGEWLSTVLEDYDGPAASTGNLISSLAEDIRYRLIELVTELEKQIAVGNRTH